MNLIILTQEDFIEQHRCRLSDDRARHIREVLRSKEGEKLEVGLLNGPKGKAKVEAVEQEGVTLECEFESEIRHPVPTIDLICALPRQQTLKKVLITSATMGVRRLHLIRANRVEKSYFNTHLLRPENYQKFLLEGLSQGKFTRMPEVIVHSRFKPFFEDTLPALEAAEALPSLKLLPDVEAKNYLDQIILPLHKGELEGVRELRILLAIGPEGGWVPFEIELMEKAGFERFRLGPWVLRVETAVAVALGQVEMGV